MGPPLVVLAAGLARRYGGCKPLAPIGPSGEAGRRPAGERRGRRGVRAHRPRPPSRDRAGRPLPRGAVLARLGRRWTSPTSAFRSAPCTRCSRPRVWSARIVPSASPTPTTSTERRRCDALVSQLEGNAGRARADRLPAVGDRGLRRPGHPRDLRGRARRAAGRSHRAPEGHPRRRRGAVRGSTTASNPRSFRRHSPLRSTSGASSRGSGTSSPER